MAKHYNKYLIYETDKFNADSYPAVEDEISLINEKTGAFPAQFKSQILISFLKDHSLQQNWVNINPELAALVTSGSLFTGCIESLFDSCRNNPVFRLGLEDYLTAKLS